MGVNKVVFNTEDGERTLVDLTQDTVTPETLAKGVTAHGADGEQIVGTMESGGGGAIETVMVTVKASSPSGVSGTAYYIDGDGESQTATTAGTITVMKGSYIFLVGSGDGVSSSGAGVTPVYTGVQTKLCFVTEGGTVKI